MSKQQLKALEYLKGCIDFSEYDWQKNTIENVYKQCLIEYGHEYNTYHYWIGQELIKQWLLWLPSCINIEFANYEIEKLMYSFWYKKSTPDMYWNLMSYLIYKNKWYELN